MPAAPLFRSTFHHAASRVVGRMALSTRLNHLPPLTPLPSADTMRSVQIEASIHHQVRGCPPATSPPCVALTALSGLFCSIPNLTHPASCLPSLRTLCLPDIPTSSTRAVPRSLCSSPQRRGSF